MKRLCWILLLANLGAFAYFKYDASVSAVSSLKPEIHPEQVKLVTPQQLSSYPERPVAQVPAVESAPAAITADAVVTDPSPVISPNLAKSEMKAPEVKAAEVKATEAKLADTKSSESHNAVQTACYEWSGFNMNRVTEAANLAQQMNIKTQTNMTSAGQDNLRYWIYKPPLASAELAQTKADELRKLGVEDFFIVQDDPKWRHAISFGVFRDEKLADKLMADLKNKGVKLLIKAPRNGGQAVIKLQQVTSQQFTNLQKTRSHFPDTVLKEIPCQ